MTLPPTSRLRVRPRSHDLPGLTAWWQVSGGHGRDRAGRAVDEMLAYHDAGFTTWDLATIMVRPRTLRRLPPAIRRAQRWAEQLAEIQAFTKWCRIRLG